MLDGAFCTLQRERKNVTQKKKKLAGAQTSVRNHAAPSNVFEIQFENFEPLLNI